MSNSARPTGTGWIIGCALLCFAIVSIANGEDDPGYVLERSTFEAWVFQQDGSLAEARRRLEADLDRIVQGVKVIADLSESEEQRLILAARGDVKRFVDAIYEVYIPLAGKSLSEEVFKDAWEQSLPLQRRLNAGLFDEGSLFQKVLARILSEEEKNVWQTAKSERLKREKALVVDAFIVDLERTVPLLKTQREKLREILLNKTPVIRNVDENGVFFIQYFFANLDENEYRDLFDAEQMKFVSSLRREGQKMSHLLVEEGIIAEEKTQ